MRFKSLLLAAVLLSVGTASFAELQNVEVGGSIRIRGNYFDMETAETSFVEQRTRLNVRADFTQDVSAFIELDSYDIWGEDFRSIYLTGADGRAVTGDDVEMYQAYIEARDMWGTPLSMRVGRQELVFGSEWLLGDNDTSAFFRGLSFDALRLTFANDMMTLDGFAAKLAETMSDFGDDDVDLYGLYFSYIGIEDVSLDAYWLFVRDDQNLTIHDIDLHTIGLRGAGVLSGFDFDVETAYQFGDVDNVRNPWFRIFNPWADVNYESWAANLEVGYTFDMTWQPRVFARAAYLGGGDPDHSWWSNDADLPFNRLFSDVEYSEFLDNNTAAAAALSNIFFYSLGVEAMPTESVQLKLVGSYLQADEKAQDHRFLWWRWNEDKTLGWELALYADYQYSEDLVVRAGYAHFFGDEGLMRHPVQANGLLPWGGDDDDDYHYLFVETEICF